MQVVKQVHGILGDRTERRHHMLCSETARISLSESIDLGLMFLADQVTKKYLDERTWGKGNCYSSLRDSDWLFHSFYVPIPIIFPAA